MSILRRNLDGLADPAARPSQVVQILDQAGPVSLALLPVLCTTPVVLEHLDRYRAAWQHIQPELTGDDLRGLGVHGVIYRTILHTLRMGRIDGEGEDHAQEEAIALAMAALG